MLRLVLLAILAVAPALPGQAAPRIKDLVEFEGVRGNDLVGYGLVVGLKGTGDAIRNAPFTEEALANLLERLGVNVSGESFKPANVAAVIVTATLPPFARPGSRIDATVSAIGDADSLLGGTLVMTPLNAADGNIYAVAQGPILAGGFEAQGEAARTQIGVPTSGSIPGGARVERELPFDFSGIDRLRLALREPDFTTAARIERVVNGALGRPVARMDDSGTVSLDLAALPRSPARLIARYREPRGLALAQGPCRGRPALGNDRARRRCHHQQRRHRPGQSRDPGAGGPAGCAAQPLRRG